MCKVGNLPGIFHRQYLMQMVSQGQFEHHINMWWHLHRKVPGNLKKAALFYLFDTGNVCTFHLYNNVVDYMGVVPLTFPSMKIVISIQVFLDSLLAWQQLSKVEVFCMICTFGIKMMRCLEMYRAKYYTWEMGGLISLPVPQCLSQYSYLLNSGWYPVNNKIRIAHT